MDGSKPQEMGHYGVIEEVIGLFDALFQCL
jgi:hypothetical protein